ncbi:hypothetical protein GF327_04075 [Candidatus Woesearchaeota archaeon]|nr:hypothetical protein [Candidatus Woesearchaeota archaeon]
MKKRSRSDFLKAAGLAAVSAFFQACVSAKKTSQAAVKKLGDGAEGLADGAGGAVDYLQQKIDSINSVLCDPLIGHPYFCTSGALEPPDIAPLIEEIEEKKRNDMLAIEDLFPRRQSLDPRVQAILDVAREFEQAIHNKLDMEPADDYPNLERRLISYRNVGDAGDTIYYGEISPSDFPILRDLDFDKYGFEKGSEIIIPDGVYDICYGSDNDLSCPFYLWNNNHRVILHLNRQSPGEYEYIYTIPDQMVSANRTGEVLSIPPVIKVRESLTTPLINSINDMTNIGKILYVSSGPDKMVRDTASLRTAVQLAKDRKIQGVEIITQDYQSLSDLLIDQTDRDRITESYIDAANTPRNPGFDITKQIYRYERNN